jgi:predicted RNA-binding Zn-ribbon protein involved in translation (DUF1610 family)
MPNEVLDLAPLNAADIAVGVEAERARFAPIMKIEYALERRDVIKQAFSKLMQDGEDYGKVAGLGKATLLQPGAQKLDNLFGLVPRFPMELMKVEEDWTGERHGGEPFFRYMVVCQLMRGDFIMGEAIGECNSWEVKYRYRKSSQKCPQCGAEAIIFTKKKSWWCAGFKGGCGAGFSATDERITSQEVGRKPNPEIFDQVNTLLKMAQKRAHVGATINATSASEFFTQDIDPDEKKAPEPEQPEPEADARPVPEELVLLFKSIDLKEKGAPLTAFGFLEKECAAAAGTHGIDEYKRVTGELRTKYPKGGMIPIPALKRCMLDVWQVIENARGVAPADDRITSGITDDDVPF